jgi:nitrite reductase (NADH) large subunit
MSAVGSEARWRRICALEEILRDTGVCASVDGRQIAIFRIESDVHAIDNHDPASGANVLSRGIVGDVGGELVVASPLYKHHYSLISGRCLEEAEYAVAVHPCRVVDGDVWLQAPPTRAPAVEPPRSEARATGGTKRSLIVIGNGMAGMRTVEELLAIAPDRYAIEVFGAEPYGNYNRILLSPVLAGEKRVEEIMLHPLAWYREHGVTLHAGDPVVAIDRVHRRVRSRAGTEVAYDRLLIATGSNPVVLPVPGHELPGVVTFRDIRDVEAMLGAARSHRAATVIGGGLLGLEAANGLRARGMDVAVVHVARTLMNRQLDATAAGLLQASLEARGIRFHLAAKTVAIEGEERVSAVRLEDGTRLASDLVVMAVGIRPNIELARAAGVRCERGILVDDTLQSFDPQVYAVGECVQHRNATYGLVAPLWDQARVCAAHLAEQGVTRYRGSLTATHLKVTGIQVFSAGSLDEPPGAESLVFKDAGRGIYKRVILEDDRLRGAVLYGDTEDGAWYTDLMRADRPIGALRQYLLFGEQFAAPPA